MARLEPGTFCPLIKEECVGLKCAFYTHVRGTDPQSGQEVDEWACAITWLPVLLINTAKEVRQGAAATESYRNETVTAAEKALNVQIALTGLVAKNLPLLKQEKTDGKN